MHTVDTEELVRYLVRSLVEHPDDVSVTRSGTETSATYQITVHPDDTGKIIGRGGRVIKAIRVLVRAVASTDGGDATVDVIG